MTAPVRPSVRPATQDDLPALLVLYRALNSHDPAFDAAAAAPRWAAIVASGIMTAPRNRTNAL